MTLKILNSLFDFFIFLIVLIKRLQLQLETRYFDSVKRILKQMQCRIWQNKKVKNDKRWILGPCHIYILSKASPSSVHSLKTFIPPGQSPCRGIAIICVGVQGTCAYDLHMTSRSPCLIPCTWARQTIAMKLLAACKLFNSDEGPFDWSVGAGIWNAT